MWVLLTLPLPTLPGDHRPPMAELLVDLICNGPARMTVTRGQGALVWAQSRPGTAMPLQSWLHLVHSDEPVFDNSACG